MIGSGAVPSVIASTSIEVDVKAVRSETIRAVRVILGKSKPADTDVVAPPLLRWKSFAARHRGESL